MVSLGLVNISLGFVQFVKVIYVAVPVVNNQCYGNH